MHIRQYASFGTGTLRLQSKCECRRIRSRSRLQDCGGHRRAGPSSHALLPAGWPRTNQHRTGYGGRSEEHTSELQSPCNLVCRLLLEKKKRKPMGAALRPLVQLRWDSAPEIVQQDQPRSGCWAHATGHIVEVDFGNAGFFFLNDGGTPEIYPLSLRDALPI